MQTYALIIATLALVYGAPLPAASNQVSSEQAMTGASGAMTNYRQVQDTLNNQLKQNGAHSNEALLNAFITGADSQIDNAIATVSDAMAPLTMGMSKVIGNALLGPFVQSVTNGAEVFLANIVGGGADLLNAQMVATLTGDYSKLASFAVKNNVDASRLETLSQQIAKALSNKAKRDDGAESGIIGALTNFKQTADTLFKQLKTGDGHASKDVINAVITGLDSQADNFAATVSGDLNGVTLGISGKIGDFLLGPLAQSITNGAEVVVSNVIGGGIDIVSDGTAKLFSNSLAKLHSAVVQLGVNSKDAEALEKVQQQVANLKAPKKSANGHGKAKRDDGAESGIIGALTNFKQTADTLFKQLKTGDGHASKDVINAVITGLDSQADNFAATVSGDLNGVTLGISGKIGDFLLGPLAQSITNGAEVVVSNVIGGGIDIVSDGTAKLFSNSLAKLHSAVVQLGVNSKDAEALEKVQQQVANLKAPKKSANGHGKAKRDDGAESGIVGAITNFKQTADTLFKQLKTGDGHASKDVINAVITGLDSQADNFAATVSGDLNGVTLGISGKIGDFLLGPLAQSITNGAEVVVSNVIGGGIDIVSDGTAKLFSNSLAKLHSAVVQLGVNSKDAEALEKVQQQVANLKAPKKAVSTNNHGPKSKRATDADLSGANGAMTNYRQVQDTLNRQLSSHNGHAAQDMINAYITGADSQIDNSIATVSNALAPFSFGLSKAIGNVLLGPFVQSVTNGAEVMLSNLVGGSADVVSDATLSAYSKSLKNLSEAASKFGVSDAYTQNLENIQQRVDQVLSKSR